VDTRPDFYRGRIAPTPTGYLHLGHARTFWTAAQRAQEKSGTLVLRVEDLDPDRCRADFVAAMLEDLRWFGFAWQEGPDVGGPHAPYTQSERIDWYREVWRRLVDVGAIYPSPHSRKDIALALLAPHDEPSSASGATSAAEEQEAIFPPTLRPEAWRDAPLGASVESLTEQAQSEINGSRSAAAIEYAESRDATAMNWRFRVPDGETIEFVDRRCGKVTRVAGVNFGDFLVWRRDRLPAYELAVVADDQAMQISEVVRGEDLLTSTARQLLIYRALGWPAPAFFHCPLMCDEQGRRLSKRSDAVSLRALRAAGKTPDELRAAWA
jgi:glutamyl-tRNA synthetase